MEQQQAPERRNNNRWLLLAALVLVLVGINGILFYMNQQKTKQNEQLAADIKVKDTKLEEQIKQYETLKADFERQSQELQSMGLANDSLEAKIASVNADLLKLRSFRAGSFSISDQKRFQQRAQNFERQLRQKDEEIAQLKKDNEVLFTETQTLKERQNRLTDTIGTIARTNQELSEKVAIASRLRAENIRVGVINRRNKEDDDDNNEFKAKKVEKIKVTFNLAQNDVAPKETKQIMMRLLEPDGAALYNLSTGGGTFLIDGNEAFYTAKQEMVYDNTRQPVQFVYAKGTDYKTGAHTVELYADGYLIGKTTFTLK
jgi:cell division protein FtsB